MAVWLRPEQDAWWSVVRQQGRRRFICTSFLWRQVLPGIGLWLLCMVVVSAVTADSWSSWGWQIGRCALGTLVVTPFVTWFLGRVFWRNAEQEWLERRQARRDG